MGQAGSSSKAKLALGGPSNILNFPEYSDVEKAKGFLSVLETKDKLIHLLEISPKILFYADRTETGVEMDKVFRQLMRFSPDNIQMIYDSAHYIRAWKDANGDDYPLEQ